MHTHNLKTGLGDVLTYTYQPGADSNMGNGQDKCIHDSEYEVFYGYRREDGRAGEMCIRDRYIMGFARQFQQYCQSPNINIKEDMTGFSLSPLYLSDEELTALVTEISKTISAVKNNKPNAERKLRTIGVIISPAEKLDN